MPDEMDFPAETTWGPEVRPANRSREAAGSIHDDATAERHGFRGGTVAGNIHLDHYGPLLLERFGPQWFEHGLLSMYFRSPTTHLDPVRVALEPTAVDGLAATSIVGGDGTLVAEGNAGIPGPGAVAALAARDRRPIEDTAELELLADLHTGQRIDAGITRVNMDRQRFLLSSRDLLTAPLDWYGEPSPWGSEIACPSVTVDALWGPFERTLRGTVKPAVGLYGAIEITNLAGPLLAGVDYHLSGVVETLSATPRTEVFWARTTASHDGTDVASLLMMIRLLRPHP